MSGFGLESIQDPRYTGDNRCPPCTLANLAIAVVASAAFGLLSPAAGMGSFVAFALVIYLKGYLVPGTPELTRRYLPPRVLRLFDKESAAGGAVPRGAVGLDSAAAGGAAGAGGANDSDAGVADSTAGADDAAPPEPGTVEVDPESVYLEIGVVEEDGDDLQLTDGFATSWHDRMDDLAGEDHLNRLADLLDRDPADLSIEEDEAGYIVTDRGDPVVAWPSTTALHAVLAAVPVLRERHSGWDDLHLEAQDRLLNALLAFVERCPDCDGTVSIAATEESGCCTTARLATVACEECGTVLLRMGI